MRVFEQVQSKRLTEVGGVEPDDIVQPPGWNPIENALREISMGIEKRAPIPRLNDGEEEAFEER